MVSARLYCASNVVDRLTKPLDTSAIESAANKNGKDNSMMQTFDESFDLEFQNNKSSVIDAATYIGSLQQGQSHVHDDAASQGDTPRKKPTTTTTSKSFETFIARQEIVLKKREENIKQVIILYDYYCMYHFFPFTGRTINDTQF
jgi:hypothetical protein